MSYIPVLASTIKTIQNIAATGAVTAWNSVVVVNAAGGNVILTLPAVNAASAGLDLEIVRTDTSVNQVQVKSANGTFNGVAAGTVGATLLDASVGMSIANDGINQYSEASQGKAGDNVVVKTAAAGGLAYTATPLDDVIIADATLGNVSITLPKIANVSISTANKSYAVKVLAVGATFAITVNADLVDKIEVPNTSPPTFSVLGGTATLPANQIGATWSFVSDTAGSRWVIR